VASCNAGRGALAATHTVLRYDRVGVGLSDRQREASEMSLPSEVALLEAIVDELDIETFSLVGISCGGCVGAAYSTRHPERVTELVIYAGYAEGAALAPAQVPTTVVHRTGDRTIPFLQGREVATLVHGARLVPLPGYTHLPWRGDGAGTAAAITSALGVTGGGGSSESIETLTEREREVLALVARGFSDALIAEHLVLSPHTVHRHIANIRGKLNVPSRSAAAAFAARAGLA
jgi:pimeloyl-ACP methyl ester carboxylesterase/DNA-binding CsgD family transcriptional regulator